MAIPSSQVLAAWVKDELQGTEWASLRAVCLQAVVRRWRGLNETQLSEFIESNLSHVAEHLREEVGEWAIDGSSPVFEIDNEPVPYIRLLEDESRGVLIRLRTIQPSWFESVCARILKELGADSQVTQMSNDGGVDFLGLNLNIVPRALGVPAACKAVVIGQAKRYKAGNVIGETPLREFVGAAMLARYNLLRDGKCGPLAPFLLAFWTTSDFEPNAKRYARALGVWYMDGRTLSNYVARLGLTDWVMELPEVAGTAVAAPASALDATEIGMPFQL